MSANEDDEWEKVETDIKALKIKADLEEKAALSSSVVIPARFLNTNNNKQNDLNFFQDNQQQSQTGAALSQAIYPTVEFAIDSSLQDALTNSRERMQLLNIENMILSFVQSSDRSFELPATQYNAFRRLLIYRVAQRFRLEHVTNDITTENNERGIVIAMYKTPDVCYPTPLLIDARFDNTNSDSSSQFSTESITQQSPISSDQQMTSSQANTSSKKVLVMKRSTSKSNEFSNKDSSNTKNQQSAAEKEKAYAVARARIFGGEATGAGDEWALAYDADTKPAETSSASSSSSSPPESAVPSGITTPNTPLVKSKSKSTLETVDVQDTKQISSPPVSINKSTSTSSINSTTSKSKSTEVSNSNSTLAAKSTKKSSDNSSNKQTNSSNNNTNNNGNNLSFAKVSTTNNTAVTPKSNAKQSNNTNTNTKNTTPISKSSTIINQQNNNGTNVNVNGNNSNTNGNNTNVKLTPNGKSQVNSKNPSPSPTFITSTPPIENNVSNVQNSLSSNIVNDSENISSTASCTFEDNIISASSSSSSKSNNYNCNNVATGKNSNTTTTTIATNSKKVVTDPTTWKDASKFTLRDKDAERSDPDFTRRTNITTSSSPSPVLTSNNNNNNNTYGTSSSGASGNNISAYAQQPPPPLNITNSIDVIKQQQQPQYQQAQPPQLIPYPNPILTYAPITTYAPVPPTSYPNGHYPQSNLYPPMPMPLSVPVQMSPNHNNTNNMMNIQPMTPQQQWVPVTIPMNMQHPTSSMGIPMNINPSFYPVNMQQQQAMPMPIPMPLYSPQHQQQQPPQYTQQPYTNNNSNGYPNQSTMNTYNQPIPYPQTSQSVSFQNATGGVTALYNNSNNNNPNNSNNNSNSSKNRGLQ